jgi:DNA (cytosine-5)-methyltransferase 1
MHSSRRRRDDTVRAIDLFCGAGGISAGLALACEDLNRDVELLAINHWPTAIDTHRENHPWGDHRNAKVEELEPRQVVPGERVDLLAAAPECTHFSTARGGRPVDPQKRASPWHVLRWLEQLYVDNFILENVPEFVNWAPVGADGRPMKSKKGKTFEAYVNALNSLGYAVDWKILNAADYGDATSRRRLFLIGRRQHRPEWPTPTHSENGSVPGTETWRPASEIIDWSDRGESIWTRSRPLVNNTMQRIAEGLREHTHVPLAAYADVIANLSKPDVEALQQDVVDVRELLAALEERTEPVLVEVPADANFGASRVATDGGTSTDIDVASSPASTVDEAGVESEADTGITGLCVPYLLGQQSNATLRETTRPVPTIATRGAISFIEADSFILPRNGYQRGLHSNPAYNPQDRPLHTVTAQNSDGHLVNPYLIQYYGNSGAKDIESPLPTVTTKSRFGLCAPDLHPWGIDIRYRMLEPPELAAAMGFPDDYRFTGTKTDVTAQIGNAVPVHLAKALCERLLAGRDPTLESFSA